MVRNTARRDALETMLRDGADLVAAVAGWHVAVRRRLSTRCRYPDAAHYDILIYNGLLCRWKMVRWKRTPHAALALAATLYAVPDDLWTCDGD